ncbi:MAG: Asp-tRNA(Asn)/Glu-tRNA(Gln) amidotransferase subunit GatC [Metamycoplasmataceae bacterium]
MKKEEFLELSKKILINANDEVIIQLEKEFDFINDNLNLLRKIDVSNIEPMFRISPKTSFLREDKIGQILDKEKVLLNSKEKDEDFIIIKRIIK